MTAAGVSDAVVIFIVLGGLAWWRACRRRRQLAAVAASERARTALMLARDLDTLLMFPPAAFEQLAGVVLERLGYTEVVHVGGANDRGADLTAADPYGQRIVVQCKRYALHRKVDSPTMQLLVGAIVMHRAHRGLMITTSSYTREALAIAGAHNIDLIDGPMFVQWARRAAVL